MLSLRLGRKDSSGKQCASSMHIALSNPWGAFPKNDLRRICHLLDKWRIPFFPSFELQGPNLIYSTRC